MRLDEICDSFGRGEIVEKEMYYEEFLGKRVKIIEVKRKKKYHKLLNLTGIVERTSSGGIGVSVDNIINEASSYGVFWFKTYELEIMEDRNMTGFNRVAIVNLLEDYSKKDYAFALYDTEWKVLQPGDLVVVNVRGKDNRVLGTVKEMMSADEYGKGVNAQVVAVANMSAYNARIEEENKAREVAKKKAAIEKELEEEINKRKTVEFYEEMANKYSDNPRLAELVAELKGLGV